MLVFVDGAGDTGFKFENNSSGPVQRVVAAGTLALFAPHPLRKKHRMDTSQIAEHMEVVGADGKHVGIVDHLDGDRLKLTHHDSQAEGKHHFLPLTAVASVSEFVTLTMSAADAEAQWVAE